MNIKCYLDREELKSMSKILESVSSVRWVSGDEPTKFAPDMYGANFMWLKCEKFGLRCKRGSDNCERVSKFEFVEKCAKEFPKKNDKDLIFKVGLDTEEFEYEMNIKCSCDKKEIKSVLKILESASSVRWRSRRNPTEFDPTTQENNFMWLGCVDAGLSIGKGSDNCENVSKFEFIKRCVEKFPKKNDKDLIFKVGLDTEEFDKKVKEIGTSLNDLAVKLEEVEEKKHGCGWNGEMKIISFCEDLKSMLIDKYRDAEK